MTRIGRCVLTALLLAWVCGCGSPGGSNDNKPGISATEKPAPGNPATAARPHKRGSFPPDSLIYVHDTEPKGLDPAYVTDYYEGFTAAVIFDGLVQVDYDLNIQPALAESWEVSDDARVFTFHLRKGVKFHDGTPFSARDVIYSFERLLDPATVSPRNWVLDQIQGAKVLINSKSGEKVSLTGLKAIDDYTVEITLEKPYNAFLDKLSMPNAYIMPAGIVERVGKKEFSEHPVGTGPWKLVEWKHEEHMVFVRNNEYWGRVPAIENLVIRIIDNNTLVTSEFSVGNVDIITVPTAEYRQWLEDPKRRPLMQKIEELNTYFLAFMCTRPNMSDPRVRRAISYGTDADTIVEYVNRQKAARAHGPIPPGTHGYTRRDDPYPYNPGKAKELLKEAGVGENLKIEFWLFKDELAQQICEAFKSDMQKIGVNVQLRAMDFAALKQGLRNEAPDMYFLSWWADYPDAENFLEPCFHSRNWGGSGNGCHYKNERVDALIDQAMFEPNREKRQQLLDETVDLIVKDAPWIFMYHRFSYLAAQPWVEGFRPHKVLNGNKFNDIGFKY
ncbi:MAG: ABC transporter substrate-binding protein [bacterium]